MAHRARPSALRAYLSQLLLLLVFVVSSGWRLTDTYSHLLSVDFPPCCHCSNFFLHHLLWKIKAHIRKVWHLEKIEEKYLLYFESSHKELHHYA